LSSATLSEFIQMPYVQALQITSAISLKWSIAVLGLLLSIRGFLLIVGFGNNNLLNLVHGVFISLFFLVLFPRFIDRFGTFLDAYTQLAGPKFDTKDVGLLSISTKYFVELFHHLVYSISLFLFSIYVILFPFFMPIGVVSKFLASIDIFYNLSKILFIGSVVWMVSLNLATGNMVTATDGVKTGSLAFADLMMILSTALLFFDKGSLLNQVNLKNKYFKRSENNHSSNIKNEKINELYKSRNISSKAVHLRKNNKTAKKVSIFNKTQGDSLVKKTSVVKKGQEVSINPKSKKFYNNEKKKEYHVNSDKYVNPKNENQRIKKIKVNNVVNTTQKPSVKTKVTKIKSTEKVITNNKYSPNKLTPIKQVKK